MRIPRPAHQQHRVFQICIQCTSTLEIIFAMPIFSTSKFRVFTQIYSPPSMVRMDAAIARHHIQHGAEVLYMIPVYEEKIKEVKLVTKVRLVVNGKHHKKHGSTYASTPSREEFLILMHLFAVLDCEFYHIDENRASLNQIKTIARIPGDPSFYEILNDYQEKNIKRMEQISFTRLHLCSSIYYKFEAGKL
eukprot:gene39181-51586_t